MCLQEQRRQAKDFAALKLSLETLYGVPASQWLLLHEAPATTANATVNRRTSIAVARQSIMVRKIELVKSNAELEKGRSVVTEEEIAEEAALLNAGGLGSVDSQSTVIAVGCLGSLLLR